MITYNKERGAWYFGDATEDEKEEILKLGEAYWAQLMAYRMAKQWIAEEAQEPPSPGNVQRDPDPDGAEIIYPEFGKPH